MITRATIDNLPSTYGIYIFYQGSIPIYIGKAINIRARVRSHLANSQLDKKEALIFKSATRLRTQLTRSDFDAILIEAALIQKYQPKYNVVWRDDKSYLYIKLTVQEKYPKILLTRRERDGKSAYFGPFKSARIASILLREIRRIIPYCTQKGLTNRPCFYSKIGLCSPCPNEIEKHKDKLLLKKYRSNIRRIRNILEGRWETVLKSMSEDLKNKVEQQNYEEAIIIRNKIERLRALIFERSFSSVGEYYSRFYEDAADQLASILRALKLVDEKFVFKDDWRMECFDISNLFGRDATASMVVFEGGVPMQSEYRRFKIRTVKEISDIFMLKEVIMRRFKRIGWRRPDLIVVDGGMPQLTITRKTLDKLRIKIPLLAIAKKPDRIIGINSSKYPHALNLIRAIRDESHRSAKKYHLLLRNKKKML